MAERQTNTNIYTPGLEKVFTDWLNPEKLETSRRGPAKFLAQGIRENFNSLQAREWPETEEKILLDLKRRVESVYHFSIQPVEGMLLRSRQIVLAARAAVRGEVETVAIYCHEGWVLGKFKNDFLAMAYLARAAKEEDPDKQMKFFGPVITLVTTGLMPHR